MTSHAEFNTAQYVAEELAKKVAELTLENAVLRADIARRDQGHSSHSTQTAQTNESS